MRLFQALEKCFPEIRKHKDALYHAHPKEYWTEERLMDLKEELTGWIMKEYLYEESIIYQLFRKASDYQTKYSMASQILIWHIYDWNIENAFSRTDTSPAQE